MNRPLVLIVAVVGLLVCVLAIVGFFSTIATNDLPVNQRAFHAEHYEAVGSAYSGGFAVGFFFCLSLIVILSALRPHRSRKDDEGNSARWFSRWSNRRPVPNREL